MKVIPPRLYNVLMIRKKLGRKSYTSSLALDMSLASKTVLDVSKVSSIAHTLNRVLQMLLQELWG